MILLQALIASTEAEAEVAAKVQEAQEGWKLAESLPIDEVIDKFVSGCVDFAFNLAGALIVFYIGKFIIKRINKIVSAILTRRHVDRSLATFLLSMIRMVTYFVLVITVVGILGVETSSFIAVFASAGVAVGMALSGTLQNFAGGVLILLIKPYKIGDYIEAQGYAGTVTEIQIFHTIINTYDNKSIIIPNGGLSTGSINNWSREDFRRIDWDVAISYGDDVDAARKAILDIFASDERVVKVYTDEAGLVSGEPESKPAEDNIPEEVKHSFIYRLFHRRHRVNSRLAQIRENIAAQNQVKRVERKPAVLVDSLGDSSVNLKARAWARSSDYWPLYYEINERIYKELPTHGINFPFPQMDVHVTQQ
jgi:small conductance mechanosensitive channel